MRALSLCVVLTLASAAVGCRATSTDITASGANSPTIETGSLGTAVVGARVSIRGQVTGVQDDSPYGHKLWVDDGTGEAQVFIDASTALIRHTNAWRVRDVLLVTGDVAKYQSLYELLPKLPSDIVLLERPEN